ncbi:uncharacterized protein A1O9_04113 [Exophiala aquamarina CBS 119918]|uniref:Transcription factor domain-containing protein n=1 Tax=Exophiala aquamarina CBS 119918 TaxID=1182545 RepID=A0A072PGR3_9EURO|nr:uncharacterized protein A1O9_04113 [Exophiala aquamarina CBS 119918]KEF59269.1 hypothetical protein A1O9_04113 [Exophiala aquamarina CBS 119918]
MPVSTEPLRLSCGHEAQGTSKLGFLALCVRLLDIRDRISRYAFLFEEVHQSGNTIDRLIQKIIRHHKHLSDYLPKLQTLEHELEALRLSLPLGSIFTTKNVFLRAYTPERTMFVMFHVWWHQCHCDLYRFTIPGFREALPADELEALPKVFSSYCRKKCLEHALGVSKVISCVIELGEDIFITDPSIAICSFHSARILFHLGQPELENLPASELLANLTTCSKILDLQAGIYPTTKLLQSGIQDLIHDPRPNSGRSSPLRSSWEAKQSSDERESSRLQAGKSSESHDICSKYSIAEEIRSLKFPAEEYGLLPSFVVESERLQGLDRNDRNDSEHFLGTMTQPDEDNMSLGLSSRVESTLPIPDTQCPTFSPRFGAWYGTEDDGLSMMLGLDLDRGLAQPDIFLDAFFPPENV